MSPDGHESVSRLVDAFRRDHPEYAERLKRQTLCRYLEQVFAEVLRGEHVAKTEERLEAESNAAGIEKADYEALVNLAAHAATDRPIEK
jgi:hypothetical protein